MPGLFISFEGLDFSGKSVQSGLLRESLAMAGHPVVAVREPGGTKISEAVRHVLLDVDHSAMSPRTEILLYSAARAQIVYEIIQPALAAGKIVIADRFVDSTTAYQGYGRKLDLEFVRRVNEFATAGLLPDATFFIDVPIAVAAGRRKSSGRAADRLEGEAQIFHERVLAGYQLIARESGGRFITIDGEQSIEAVTQNIRKHLKAKFGLTIADSNKHGA
jgi:dTMP kinase